MVFLLLFPAEKACEKCLKLRFRDGLWKQAPGNKRGSVRGMKLHRNIDSSLCGVKLHCFLLSLVKYRPLFYNSLSLSSGLRHTSGQSMSSETPHSLISAPSLQALLKMDCQGLVARLVMDFVLLTTAVEVAGRWRELAERLAKVSRQQMDAYEAPHRDKNGVVDSEVGHSCR